MLKHPIYTALGIALCFSLFAANQRGWSFLYTITPTHWFAGGRGTHK